MGIPALVMSPAACQVVPAVSCLRSRRTTSRIPELRQVVRDARADRAAADDDDLGAVGEGRGLSVTVGAPRRRLAVDGTRGPPAPGRSVYVAARDTYREGNRMRRRGLAVVMVLAMVGGALVAATAPAGGQTAPPGYVSVIFGRTQWAHDRDRGRRAVRPRWPARSRSGSTHDALAARGLIGDRGRRSPHARRRRGSTASTATSCTPGWDLLETWHGEGWRFVSGGTHADVTTLSYEESIAETCGWLSTFAAHGMDASGLFAYGNNTWTTAAQTDPDLAVLRVRPALLGLLGQRPIGPHGALDAEDPLGERGELQRQDPACFNFSAASPVPLARPAGRHDGGGA